MCKIFLTDTHLEEAEKIFQKHLQENERVEYEIYFPADFAMSKIIRDMVGKIFDAYKVSKKWRGRFILICDELINNSIEHGSEEWDENICKIKAGKKDEKFFIQFEVHDNGKSGDLKEIQEEIDDAQKCTEKPSGIYMDKRGRWLFMITKKLVDTLHFEKSEKWWLAVKIEKTIEPSDV